MSNLKKQSSKFLDLTVLYFMTDIITSNIRGFIKEGSGAFHHLLMHDSSATHLPTLPLQLEAKMINETTVITTQVSR